MSMFECEADITINTHTVHNTNLDEPLGKWNFNLLDEAGDASVSTALKNFTQRVINDLTSSTYVDSELTYKVSLNDVEAWRNP